MVGVSEIENSRRVREKGQIAKISRGDGISERGERKKHATIPPSSTLESSPTQKRAAGADLEKSGKRGECPAKGKKTPMRELIGRPVGV